jgi:hypothetical protein
MALIDVVLEDLELLRESLGADPSEVLLRRESVILRRLLVDGRLGAAWRTAGNRREPKIEFIDFQHILEPAQRKDIVWASIGGARSSNGTTIAGTRYKQSALGSAPSFLGPARPPTITSLGLSRYIDGVVAVAKGRAVKRRQMVKYVANKLGGAHYDETRGATEDERVYSSLDDAATSMTFHGRTPIYAEILAIGQDLLRSPDLSAWIPGGGLPPVTLEMDDKSIYHLQSCLSSPAPEASS